MSISLNIPGFTGSPLNRTEENRPDDATLAQWRARDDARVMVLDQFDPVIDDSGHLQWLPSSSLPSDIPLFFLGLDGESPCFLAPQLSDDALPHTTPAARRQSIWQALATLSQQECAIYACARSLAEWHQRSKFCGACGQQTQIIRGGWARNCNTCATEHFPRTDPVVIMLALHDDRVLLGRQHRYPPKQYSALAGFIEVGESIEEAVSRELYEEAGVTTKAVHYVTSQPWPFPSSLMIACIADVIDDHITLDTNELEHAFWASRHEVQQALNGTGHFKLPPAYAIAHTLLSYWVNNPA